MAFKHGEDYVVYDFETTGLVDKDTKILEIGATKYNKDGEVIGRFNRYLDHGLEGDKNTTYGWQAGSSAEQAAGTHKIKYDTIKKHGGDPRAVIEEFSKFVGGAQMGGHNSNDFDRKILEINAGSDYEKLFGSSSHFDTLEGSLKYRRRGDKLNRVDTLVKIMDYNVGFDVNDVEKETQRGGIYNYVKQNISEIGAHSAAWDVKATGGILKTINKVDNYATGKSKLEDIIGDRHTRNFLFDQNTIVKREDGSQVNVMNELIDNAKDKNNVNSRRAFVEQITKETKKEGLGIVFKDAMVNDEIDFADMLHEYLGDDNMPEKDRMRIIESVKNNSNDRVFRNERYGSAFMDRIVENEEKISAKTRTDGFASGSTNGEKIGVEAKDSVEKAAKEEADRLAREAERLKMQKGGKAFMAFAGIVAATAVVGTGIAFARGATEKEKKLSAFDSYANNDSNSYMQI